MSNKIGFMAEQDPVPVSALTEAEQTTGRCSMVEVLFPGWSRALAYYNDQFDLQPRDMVYVDGKMEGKRGLVVSVNYAFKIDLNRYKRVIGMVDRTARGKFFTAGSHFISFDPTALPRKQVRSWFKPPETEEPYIVEGKDTKTTYPLSDLSGLTLVPGSVDAGKAYYEDDRVKYLSVEQGQGYALVEGNSDFYEVEFEHQKGNVSNLICSCWCSAHCKHEVAVLFQLKDLLEKIEENYGGQYQKTGYFSAAEMAAFFYFLFDGKKKTCLELS